MKVLTRSMQILQRLRYNMKNTVAFFFSKSQLYKYLKDGYRVTTQPSFSLIASLLALPIFIVRSRAVISAMGLGLTFWCRIYAIIAIILVPHIFFFKSNLEITTCLDTSCNVTLVNKVWLLGQLSKQKINKISTLLKVREISTSKYKSV